ncbi:UDP-N-acetylglucosamine 2-epimerase (non-hydrolyzing) [Paenibacillus lautus]|uniref:non-hydrolyzing UDP-N-acetylglucosamine 2-epimerase n=1 Tax=Paenibacillus TaxID=44249 RepID=UPI002DBB6275|nr:UDP-N-acetylglucosamine 2-epimerase (non-hydrolyzing) [Paenibacillus lautus]MEC0310678.1 UDP-N-acetylglucosamine 2-epimerase (non-hydrolyzing) [Paenibacillus lautus]
MNRLKVMTIVGTRPEIIKLSMIIKELDRFTDHILVHSGQNFDYELNEIFFDDLGIRKPNHFLGAAKESAIETIAEVIKSSDKVMEIEKPDALLLYGDTNTCMAVISAKKRRIPIFHMEAGNRCFDQRVPEEINRKIVDHLSDINLPLTEHARRYLIDEGIKQETIIKSGSTLHEVIEFYKPQINRSDILDRFSLTEKNYFVVSAHREENIDDETNFYNLIETLNEVVEKYNMTIIFSTHPRTRKKLDKLDIRVNERVVFTKPLGFFDYLKLQQNAFCVLSDSGTITEESSILKFPAITIRNAIERPEGMDEGTLIMSGLSKDRVIQSIDVVTEQRNSPLYNIDIVKDYEGKNVSQKVVRVILSYTDYINRTVWKKS